MNITYSASTVATLTNSTTITGQLNDNHDLDTPACQANSGKCPWQTVNVFVDELFGGYMFQDPNAACNAAINRFCRAIVIVANRPVTGSQSKLTPLPAAESAAVLALRSIYQELYSYAAAHPSEGYPSSLREVDPNLASGHKGGYHITYVVKASPVGGKISTYQVLFDPLEPIKSRSRYFFMDETGTIRSSQTGTPDARSPVLQ
jgi:hypothetical protein